MENLNFNDEVKQGISLVYFGAEWCGPCKMMKPIINELSNEVKDAKILQIDVDKFPDLAGKYNIRSVPTFIVFKDGQKIEISVGANSSKDYFINLIDNAREQIKKKI